MKKLLIAGLLLTSATSFADWKPSSKAAIHRDLMTQCRADLPIKEEACNKWARCSVNLLEEGWPTIMAFLQDVAKQPAIGAGSAYFVGRVCMNRLLNKKL